MNASYSAVTRRTGIHNGTCCRCSCPAFLFLPPLMMMMILRTASAAQLLFIKSSLPPPSLSLSLSFQFFFYSRSMSRDLSFLVSAFHDSFFFVSGRNVALFSEDHPSRVRMSFLLTGCGPRVHGHGTPYTTILGLLKALYRAFHKEL